MSTVPSTRDPVSFEDIDEIVSSAEPPPRLPQILPMEPITPKTTAATRARRDRLKTRKNRYRAAMQRACTEKDLQAIIAKAVEQAKEGDRDARNCVLAYLVGKPEHADGQQHAGLVLVTEKVQAMLFGDCMPRQ